MTRVSLLALLLLASCEPAFDWEAAHKRYHMMIENKAPREDMCAESKRNAKAALNAMDETEYKAWVQFEKEDCS